MHQYITKIYKGVQDYLTGIHIMVDDNEWAVFAVFTEQQPIINETVYIVTYIREKQSDKLQMGDAYFGVPR